jgi:zinc transporter ZupT
VGNVKNWSAALQLLAVGFYVPLSLLMPTGIGFWLDQRAGNGFPAYTLIGLGIGTAIMVYGLYRMVRPFLKETTGETKEEEKSKQ